jgi:enhancer of yellow 2 transcription factor
MLHDRLVSSGWRDELKEYCKEIIRRKGLEKVTVEELVAEINPKGRGLSNLCLFFTNVIFIFIKFS